MRSGIRNEGPPVPTRNSRHPFARANGCREFRFPGLDTSRIRGRTLLRSVRGRRGGVFGVEGCRDHVQHAGAAASHVGGRGHFLNDEASDGAELVGGCTDAIERDGCAVVAALAARRASLRADASCDAVAMNNLMTDPGRVKAARMDAGPAPRYRDCFRWSRHLVSAEAPRPGLAGGVREVSACCAFARLLRR